MPGNPAESNHNRSNPTYLPPPPRYTPSTTHDVATQTDSLAPIFNHVEIQTNFAGNNESVVKSGANLKVTFDLTKNETYGPPPTLFEKTLAALFTIPALIFTIPFFFTGFPTHRHIKQGLIHEMAGEGKDVGSRSDFFLMYPGVLYLTVRSFLDTLFKKPYELMLSYKKIQFLKEFILGKPFKDNQKSSLYYGLVAKVVARAAQLTLIGLAGLAIMTGIGSPLGIGLGLLLKVGNMMIGSAYLGAIFTAALAPFTAFLGGLIGGAAYLKWDNKKTPSSVPQTSGTSYYRSLYRPEEKKIPVNEAPQYLRNATQVEKEQLLKADITVDTSDEPKNDQSLVIK